MINTHTTPVKVVIIVCKRIVLANDNHGNCAALSDFIERCGVGAEYSLTEGYVSVSFDADDEILYDICGAVTEFIIQTAVKSDINKILDFEYNCFNKDEKSLIVGSVLSSDCLLELTGRIYIFLKCEKTVNPVGFYRFMCRDIFAAVYDSVMNEADKLMALNDTGDFIRVLKYFASISSESIEKAELTADDRGIRISHVEGNVPYADAEFADMSAYGEDVLAELVSLNPKSIIVHGREIFDKNILSDIIKNVFEKRITYAD